MCGTLRHSPLKGNMRHALHAVLGVALSAATISATTVEPLDFDQIVSRADLIFVGQVRTIANRVLPASSGAALPRTIVEFTVIDAIDGVQNTSVSLEFAGGQLNDRTLVVAGTPTFRMGEQVAIFAYRERTAVSQIVGITQGLFRVSVDPAGRRYVLRNDGTPLPTLGSIGQSAFLVSSDLIRPMRLEDFVAGVRMARLRLSR